MAGWYGGKPVLCGSTQHLKMEAVGQRWSHHREKNGEYEDAYELSLERPQLIHKYRPKSTAVLMQGTRFFPELAWTSSALSMTETGAPQLASVSLWHD